MVYLPMEVQASTMNCTQPDILNPQDTCDMQAHFVNNKDGQRACKYHYVYIYIEHKYGKGRA